MVLNAYQELARRTQNMELSREEKQRHALFGMASELGEIFDAGADKSKLIDEMSDLCWFVAEYCDTQEVEMDSFGTRWARPVDICTREDFDEARKNLVLSVGKIMAVHQKEYQGHEANLGSIKGELENVLYQVSALARAYKSSLADVLVHNIDKLKKRFPDGFQVERSVYREV